MVGSAVATIVWSMAARNRPSMSPEKMISTWRRGRDPAGGAATSMGG
jgi:hypothetical protein